MAVASLSCRHHLGALAALKAEDVAFSGVPRGRATQRTQVLKQSWCIPPTTFQINQTCTYYIVK